jgi:hypothetical protein
LDRKSIPVLGLRDTGGIRCGRLRIFRNGLDANSSQLNFRQEYFV